MILDTNAISALFAGDDKLARILAVSARHHLPVIVLGEYRYGVKSSRHQARLEELLDQLERESELLAVEAGTGVAYSEVRHELRQRGTPLPENDVWIAALARQHQLPIVSQDKHFDLVSGLRRIDW